MAEAEDRHIVQCSKCQRAVWNTDVNRTGRCSDCQGKRGDSEPETEELAPEA